MARIHGNCFIDSIGKHYYLKLSLESYALKSIQAFDICNENYSTIWNNLYSRYDNEKLIVTNYIKALFNMETLNFESSISLQNLVDNIYQNISASKNLNHQVDQWDNLTYLSPLIRPNNHEYIGRTQIV